MPFSDHDQMSVWHSLINRLSVSIHKEALPPSVLVKFKITKLGDKHFYRAAMVGSVRL